MYLALFILLFRFSWINYSASFIAVLENWPWLKKEPLRPRWTQNVWTKPKLGQILTIKFEHTILKHTRKKQTIKVKKHISGRTFCWLKVSHWCSRLKYFTIIRRTFEWYSSKRNNCLYSSAAPSCESENSSPLGFVWIKNGKEPNLDKEIRWEMAFDIIGNSLAFVFSRVHATL